MRRERVGCALCALVLLAACSGGGGAGDAGASGAGDTNTGSGTSGGGSSGGQDGSDGGSTPGGGGGSGSGATAWNPILSDIGAGTDPALAVSATGDAIVVFASGGDMHACRLDFDQGWCAAPELLDDTNKPTRTPSVAMDDAGNILAGWAQDVDTGAGARMRAFARVHDAALGWLAPQAIDGDLTGDTHDSASAPLLAMDASGYGLALFTRARTSGGAATHLFANRFVPGSGWQGAEDLLTDDDVGAVRPAMDGNGNTALVFLHEDERAHARYRAQGGAWQAQVLNGAPGHDRDPAVAMDTDGYALALWSFPGTADGGTTPTGPEVLHWSLYTPGAGWSPALAVQANAAVAQRRAALRFEAPGKALAVWEAEYAHAHALRFARFDGAGWPDGDAIVPGVTGDARAPRLALNASGDGFLLWRRLEGGQHDLWVMRYDDGAWGTPHALEAGSADALHPRLGVDGNGFGVAVWEENGRIRAARFH